jgi:hypothetical protein
MFISRNRNCFFFSPVPIFSLDSCFRCCRCCCCLGLLLPLLLLLLTALGSSSRPFALSSPSVALSSPSIPSPALDSLPRSPLLIFPAALPPPLLSSWVMREGSCATKQELRGDGQHGGHESRTRRGRSSRQPQAKPSTLTRF